jgi:hypothetical protein
MTISAYSGLSLIDGVDGVAMEFEDISETSIITEQYARADASAGPIDLTLPNAALNQGKIYTVKKVDSSSNTVTILGYSGQTIDDESSLILTTQGQTRTLISNAENWDIFQ